MTLHSLASLTTRTLTRLAPRPLSQCPRALSTTAPLRLKPRRSPRVRDLERQSKRGEVRLDLEPQTPSAEQAAPAWPTALLKAACESGGLPLEYTKAIRVLEDFRTLGQVRGGYSRPNVQEFVKRTKAPSNRDTHTYSTLL